MCVVLVSKFCVFLEFFTALIFCLGTVVGFGRYCFFEGEFLFGKSLGSFLKSLRYLGSSWSFPGGSGVLRVLLEYHPLYSRRQCLSEPLMSGSRFASPTPRAARSGKGSRMSLPNSLSLSSPAAAVPLACVVSLSSVGRALPILHASFPGPAQAIPQFPLYMVGFVDFSGSH